MTLVLNGISVSRGVVIGDAYLYQLQTPEIRKLSILSSKIPVEIARLKAAVNTVHQQLEAVRDEIPRSVPSDVVSLINTPLLILDDASFVDMPTRIIEERCCNVEWALVCQRNTLNALFEQMEDPYLRTRRDDIGHIIDRILRVLMCDDAPELSQKNLEGRVVVASDLAPADILQLQKQGVAAFVTEFGGPNSHTAILARSLEIPAIVGIHNVCNYIQHDERVALDAERGMIFAEPERYELDYFSQRQAADLHRKADLEKVGAEPAKTVDGQSVVLMANIEMLDEVAEMHDVHAMGVGLYRTEMQYLNRNNPPDEEELFQTYKSIVDASLGEVVTIRTLDLGVENKKELSLQSAVSGVNPALGLRAIRMCLKDEALFGPQLRAILRASAYGPVRLMAPMVSGLQEYRQLLSFLDNERRCLRSRGQAFDEHMKVGAMIEVPAAALIADVLSQEMDFLSIGTNDLIQYTLAADRLDDEMNYLYDPLHPAVLRLIKMVIDAGRANDTPVAMCGEMAGDVRYTRLLLGMGLREFSMYPATLLEVKYLIGKSDASQYEEWISPLWEMKSSEDIYALVSKMNAS